PRDDVVRHAKALRERGAVARVPVEELDHAGRVARGTHAFLHPLLVDRIHQPDAALGDQRVRRPPQELLPDPAEAEVGLVAEPDHAAVVRTSPLARTTPSSQRASTSPPWNCWRYRSA